MNNRKEFFNFNKWCHENHISKRMRELLYRNGFADEDSLVDLSVNPDIIDNLCSKPVEVGSPMITADEKHALISAMQKFDTMLKWRNQKETEENLEVEEQRWSFEWQQAKKIQQFSQREKIHKTEDSALAADCLEQPLSTYKALQQTTTDITKMEYSSSKTRRSEGQDYTAFLMDPEYKDNADNSEEMFPPDPEPDTLDSKRTAHELSSRATVCDQQIYQQPGLPNSSTRFKDYGHYQMRRKEPKVIEVPLSISQASYISHASPGGFNACLFICIGFIDKVICSGSVAKLGLCTTEKGIQKVQYFLKDDAESSIKLVPFFVNDLRNPMRFYSVDEALPIMKMSSILQCETWVQETAAQHYPATREGRTAAYFDQNAQAPWPRSEDDEESLRKLSKALEETVFDAAAQDIRIQGSVVAFAPWGVALLGVSNLSGFFHAVMMNPYNPLPTVFTKAYVVWIFGRNVRRVCEMCAEKLGEANLKSLWSIELLNRPAQMTHHPIQTDHAPGIEIKKIETKQKVSQETEAKMIEVSSAPVNESAAVHVPLSQTGKDKQIDGGVTIYAAVSQMEDVTMARKGISTMVVRKLNPKDRFPMPQVLNFKIETWVDFYVYCQQYTTLTYKHWPNLENTICVPPLCTSEIHFSPKLANLIQISTGKIVASSVSQSQSFQDESHKQHKSYIINFFYGLLLAANEKAVIIQQSEASKEGAPSVLSDYADALITTSVIIACSKGLILVEIKDAFHHGKDEAVGKADPVSYASLTIGTSRTDKDKDKEAQRKLRSTVYKLARSEQQLYQFEQLAKYAELNSFVAMNSVAKVAIVFGLTDIERSDYILNHQDICNFEENPEDAMNWLHGIWESGQVGETRHEYKHLFPSVLPLLISVTCWESDACFCSGGGSCFSLWQQSNLAKHDRDHPRKMSISKLPYESTMPSYIQSISFAPGKMKTHNHFLTPEQLRIWAMNGPRQIIMGVPGSGKTMLIQCQALRRMFEAENYKNRECRRLQWKLDNLDKTNLNHGKQMIQDIKERIRLLQLTGSATCETDLKHAEQGITEARRKHLGRMNKLSRMHLKSCKKHVLALKKFISLDHKVLVLIPWHLEDLYRQFFNSGLKNAPYLHHKLELITFSNPLDHDVNRHSLNRSKQGVMCFGLCKGLQSVTTADVERFGGYDLFIDDLQALLSIPLKLLRSSDKEISQEFDAALTVLSNLLTKMQDPKKLLTNGISPMQCHWYSWSDWAAVSGFLTIGEIVHKDIEKNGIARFCKQMNDHQFLEAQKKIAAVQHQTTYKKERALLYKMLDILETKWFTVSELTHCYRCSGNIQHFLAHFVPDAVSEDLSLNWVISQQQGEQSKVRICKQPVKEYVDPDAFVFASVKHEIQHYKSEYGLNCSDMKIIAVPALASNIHLLSYCLRHNGGADETEAPSDPEHSDLDSLIEACCSDTSSFIQMCMFPAIASSKEHLAVLLLINSSVQEGQLDPLHFNSMMKSVFTAASQACLFLSVIDSGKKESSWLNQALHCHKCQSVCEFIQFTTPADEVQLVSTKRKELEQILQSSSVIQWIAECERDIEKAVRLLEKIISHFDVLDSEIHNNLLFSAELVYDSQVPRKSVENLNEELANYAANNLEEKFTALKKIGFGFAEVERKEAEYAAEKDSLFKLQISKDFIHKSFNSTLRSMYNLNIKIDAMLKKFDQTLHSSEVDDALAILASSSTTVLNHEAIDKIYNDFLQLEKGMRDLNLYSSAKGLIYGVFNYLICLKMTTVYLQPSSTSIAPQGIFDMNLDELSKDLAQKINGSTSEIQRCLQDFHGDYNHLSSAARTNILESIAGLQWSSNKHETGHESQAHWTTDFIRRRAPLLMEKVKNIAHKMRDIVEEINSEHTSFIANFMDFNRYRSQAQEINAKTATGLLQSLMDLQANASASMPYLIHLLGYIEYARYGLEKQTAQIQKRSPQNMQWVEIQEELKQLSKYSAAVKSYFTGILVALVSKSQEIASYEEWNALSPVPNYLVNEHLLNLLAVVSSRIPHCRVIRNFEVMEIHDKSWTLLLDLTK